MHSRFRECILLGDFFKEYRMAVIYLCIILLCAMGNNILKNIFAKGDVCTDGDNAIYNVIACGIGAPLSLIGSGFYSVSGTTLLLASLFGLSMAGVAITTIKALRNGPMSLTVLFGNFSMVIPIFFGFFFWHEDISLLRIAGIILMFFAVYFIINPSVDVKISRKWVIYAFLYFLTVGLMALFQLVESKSVEGENSMFLFWGFTFATLWMLLYLVICQRRKETRMSIKLFSRENLNGLLVGIFGGVSHICTMKVLMLMDSTVYYPVKDGICIICNALLGYFLFHENLHKKQLIGMAFGFVSVMILTAF